MSLSLTNVQQTEFDALVKILYQSRGFLLRDSVRTRTDVIGAMCQFRRMNQVQALPSAFQATAVIQDPVFSQATTTLVKYMAPTSVDEIQDLTVNFDSKRELAQAVAMAVGRRSDQIIINALGAGGTSQGTPTIAAAGTNMSFSKLRNVIQYFEQDAVPIGERYIAMSGNNLRALLADDRILSRFYTSNDTTVTGTLNYAELLSMSVRIIPTMVEGGLPLGVTAANVRNCYAWHKMAMGMAIGQDMRTEVNYLPLSTSWLVNGIFYAGAVTVDNLGVFYINCDESVNP